MASGSSLRSLRPPVADPDDAAASSGDEDDNTWDSTFQREQAVAREQQQQAGSATLASHAVSVGPRVFGIASTPENSSSSWWTWQRSLTDNQSKSTMIHTLTSNRHGTVLAAATDAGVVTLLRGSDGQVLATRRVVEDDHAAAALMINLTWIPGKGGRGEDEDVLLMEAPPPSSSSSEEEEDAPAKLILVSNIQGHLLNHPSNPEVVANAAQNMQIQTISLEAIRTVDLRAITGCFTNNATIRLVACDSDGKFAIFDYHLADKQLRWVQSSVALLEGDEEWMIDFDAGLHVQQQQCNGSSKAFVLCSGSTFSKDNTQIKAAAAAPGLFWFDPVSLRTVCQFALPRHCDASAVTTSSNNQNRSKVMAIETIRSFSANGSDGDDATLAVVVAEKYLSSAQQEGGASYSSTGAFHVIQVLVEEVMGLTVLRNPHVLYTIPTDEGTISVALACVASSVPYAFRYKLWKKGETDCAYKQFEPDETISSTIGRVRSLLWRGELDQADEVVASVGVDLLEKEQYADFHPSEIALHRLKFSLTKASPDALEQAQICLRRLAAGAVSSNEKGLTLLLEAVDFVVKSPSNLSLDSFIVGLKAVVSTLEQVISTNHSEKLQCKKLALVRQICALEFLSKTSGTNSDSPSVALAQPFHTIRSPSHLFRVLVKEHQFERAELLYRSNLRDQLSAATLVLPLLELGANVQPQDYISLISEVAFPNLVINDELLARLKFWCCEVADALDDKNEEHLNLDAAILLLQTVDKGARELQLKIHSSFGSFTPFSEQVETGHASRRSPRSNSKADLDMSNSGDFSVLLGAPALDATTTKARRTGSGRGSKLPIPTILEIAAPKRQRAYSQRGRADEEAVAGNEDCVKDKLAAAQCLREARKLGLGREVTSLRDFEQNGGTLHVAKELVRWLSEAADSHGDRTRSFSEILTPFCRQFGINEDTAKLECTIELCRGKNIFRRAIEESCSVARSCSSVIVRCNVALTVLRAALLCDSAHGDLLQLAKEAIVWASCDSGLQSELEEAARLLQIDNIVLKYCGSQSRELFRVENPRHSVRLLSFVTKHVERETVLQDALSLCDAFHHLSSQDAVSTILQNAILHENSALSVTLLQTLIDKDALLASRALVGAILVSQEILEECSRAIRSGCPFDRVEQHRERALRVSARCGDLVLCAIEKALVIPRTIGAALDCYLQNFSLDSLRDAFLRIERLQRDYSVFVSLTELLQTRVALDRASQFLEDVAACHTTGELELLSTKLTAAKRACCLLAAGSKADERDLWVAASVGVAKVLMNERQDGEILDFLSDTGLLQMNDASTDLPGRAHLSIALSLCVEAANRNIGQISFDTMKMVVKASSLLRDWSIMSSRGSVLVSVIALAGHLDVASHVFSRADEGVGESIDTFSRALRSRAWARTDSADTKTNDLKLAVHRPTLHSSWYVGDGLLLPPGESLSACLRFCKSLVAVSIGSDDSSTELSELVGGRGAHSLALRVLCTSAAVQVSCGNVFDESGVCQDFQSVFDATTKSLAERSLGGTGTGITSSVIDSQQAVSFLLSLPMKQAFAMYRSCLPTAVKTQNFERLFTLANIGIVAGSVESAHGTGPIFSVGWKRQRKFREQCQQVAAKANWWSILQGIGVEFDSQLFPSSEVNTSTSEDSTKDESKYAASLVPQMIAKMSKSRNATDVLRLTSLYAETFCLSRDLVLHRHVEFLLSPSRATFDQGPFDPINCEKMVRASLQLLNPPLKRSAVLRRCLVTLDKTDASGQDYELYNLVLTLYQETLNHVVDRDTTIVHSALALFEAELEIIDRRRDALAILSSFFAGDRAAERPPFSKFFLPLKKTFNQSVSANETTVCGILGLCAHGEFFFDPLQPLEHVFSTALDTSAVTALAPLCLPLGLPLGYIHARSLMARFRHARDNRVAQPYFENDVNPVLKRIRSPTERAVLAEWCAEQYQDNDAEKLKCLGVVLQSCTQASNDIEQKRRHFPNDERLEQEEMQALEKVRRTNAAQDALSDKLRAKAILLAADGRNKGAVKLISDALVGKLDLHIQSIPDEMSPEALIDFLYTTGSLLASQACLDSEQCFSVAQFRRFCSIVHSACQSIAEQHSHIDHGHRARRFAQRWLFYGDEGGTSQVFNSDSVAPEPTANNALEDIEEEDTVNFVMDLSGIQNASDTDWSSGGATAPARQAKKTSCEEEPSALQDSSARELSEKTSRRAALRIAFVMACSGDHPSIPEETSAKENSDSNKHGIKRRGLLGKLQTKRDSVVDRVQDHCLELLRIVFAKSGTSAMIFSRWNSFDSADTSMSSVSKKENPKTITFAMRHRALRAASILCPQEALEKVAGDESFLRSNNNEHCSLLQCTFGVFLAKEIEEMGLPLPHSDLVQLSSMNFVSYARALWRHHRDDDILSRLNGKGRLLLLLTEMSLKSETTDPSFVSTLLEEMVNSNLPRTLLLSLEQLVESRAGSSHRLEWEPIAKAIAAVARAVLSETRRLLSKDAEVDRGIENDFNDGRSTMETFERLYKVVAVLCDSEQQGHEQLSQFAKMVAIDCESALENPIAEEVLRITKLACERANKYSRLPVISHSESCDPKKTCGL